MPQYADGLFYIICEETLSPDSRKHIFARQFFESLTPMNFAKYKRVPWMIRKGTSSSRKIYKRSALTPNINFLVHFLKEPYPLLMEKKDHRGWFNTPTRDLHYLEGRMLVKEFS